MRKIFILCNGTAERYGGAIKQLLPIQGEPLILRTLRQVHARTDDPVFIVTWRPELRIPGENIIDIGRTGPLSETILKIFPQFGDNTVLLLGDVVYFDEALDTILNLSGYWLVGRWKESPIKAHSERYALIIPYEYQDRLREACHYAINKKLHGLMGIATAHNILRPIIAARLPPGLRNIRDYFLWHIYPGWSWIPGHTHNIYYGAEDLDNPEEYRAFLDFHGLYGASPFYEV